MITCTSPGPVSSHTPQVMLKVRSTEWKSESSSLSLWTPAQGRSRVPQPSRLFTRSQTSPDSSPVLSRSHPLCIHFPSWSCQGCGALTRKALEDLLQLAAALPLLLGRSRRSRSSGGGRRGGSARVTTPRGLPPGPGGSGRPRRPPIPSLLHVLAVAAAQRRARRCAQVPARHPGHQVGHLAWAGKGRVRAGRGRLEFGGLCWE